jgi:hypothetical protein
VFLIAAPFMTLLTPREETLARLDEPCEAVGRYRHSGFDAGQEGGGEAFFSPVQVFYHGMSWTVADGRNNFINTSKTLPPPPLKAPAGLHISGRAQRTGNY